MPWRLKYLLVFKELRFRIFYGGRSFCVAWFFGGVKGVETVGLEGGNKLPLLKGWLLGGGFGKSLLRDLAFLCCSTL